MLGGPGGTNIDQNRLPGSLLGVYVRPGKDMDNGFKLSLDQIKYRAGVHKLEGSTADTEAKPNLAPTRARRLGEKVNGKPENVALDSIPDADPFRTPKSR